MESLSSDQYMRLLNTLRQMHRACVLIEQWISDVTSSYELVCDPEGLKTLAAVSMQIESIGEGVKKLDYHYPGFLQSEAPQIPWKDLKGMRDFIAHGYFNIDAAIVFDVAKNEIPKLRVVFNRIINSLL